MGAHEQFAPPPPAAVSRVLATFGRAELAGFIAVAIDLLDLAEPDPEGPDFRPCSDGLPGDPDDTEANGDDHGDTAWIEWQTRGSHKLDAGLSERMARRENGTMLREDDEDNDPAEDDGDSADGDFAEDEPAARFGFIAHGPGCIVSDPDRDDMEPDVLFPHFGMDQRHALPFDPAIHRQIVRPHIDRVRRTKCERVGFRGIHYGEYRLIDRDALDQPEPRP